MRKPHLIFFHTLNDFSGSPNILSQVIIGLVEKGYKVDLYTSSINNGFLAGIEGVKYHEIFYKFYHNRLLTFLLFTIMQIRYFFCALRYGGKKEVVFYLNTILPFGAALGAYLIKKPIIYHIHEYPVRKNLMHRLGIKIFLKTASKSIFVSRYLYNKYDIVGGKKILIHNSLSLQFTEAAFKYKKELSTPAKILMVSSLKKYKGVSLFADLAGLLPEFSFKMVLNATENEIKRFFLGRNLPLNISFFSGRYNLREFYQEADLVINMSIPGLCIESFGLTILEAITYGIPVIVPPVGGITELVDDGKNGFKVDPENMEVLKEKILYILKDKQNYLRMSGCARSIAQGYSNENLISKIEEVINN
jgi:L-malate glycosyltransferase